MQSPHFDASAYQGAIYAPASGFETGTIRLHHTGYAGEPDASCYSNYVGAGVQAPQGYNCRDPPTYSETSSFFHPAGIMSGFGNVGYYKTPNRQMDLSDYTGASMMARPQENFLMKPPDTLGLAGSPSAYDSNNSGSTTATNTSTNVHDDQPHHHHHHHNHHHHPAHQQQQHHHHLHHHHQTAYEDASQNMDTAKLMQDNSTSVFSHNSVKLEPMKMEPSHSHTEFDKSLNSSTMQSSTSTLSRTVQEENEIPSHQSSICTSSSSCDQSSRRLSPKHSDNKVNVPLSEKASEASQNKDNSEEKKEEEAPSGDSKPTMSYIALIAKAILESEQRRLNLGSIYNWIEKHYPFYKNKGQGWRNSVRHNLSLNDCFIKAGRCEDGKGNYWAIHPANIQDFMRGDFRQRRRSRRRGRKKECDLSMYHVPNGYLQSPGTPLASGMTFNPAALTSIYSPYTEAERRLDEALLRQSMNNPFVKWYQQGVSTPGYGVSTSPPACSTGVYPNSTPVQWPQAYTDTNSQSMYPALNSTFPR